MTTIVLQWLPLINWGEIKSWECVFIHQARTATMCLLLEEEYTKLYEDHNVKLLEKFQ